MVSAGRVFALIDQSNYEPVQADSELAIREGNIRFEHVCFSYDGVNQILDDISFSVKKGKPLPLWDIQVQGSPLLSMS